MNIEHPLPGDQSGLCETRRAGRTPTVLVVEDDEFNRLAIKLMVESLGFSTIAALNGQECLDILGRHAVDCILMDIQMPVMDGLEATRRIRAAQDSRAVAPPERREEGAGQGASELPGSGFSPESAPLSGIPIIALTAYAMLGDREKFLAAGMDDYLAKPVRLADLEHALRKALPE